jgi:hypothetical protein
MRRRAFTLFQLLTVLGALTLLFALLLPAFMQARLRAIRAQGANNLKQMALATHNYHDVNAFLPAGCDPKGFSAHAHLLPYIEQAAVFQTIDFKQDVGAAANAEARRIIIKTYLSPFDPVRSVSADSGATNYLFCAGSLYALADNNGPFPAGQPKITLTDVSNGNGTSNTFLAGETLKGDAGMKAMDMRRQHIAYKADALKGLKEGAGVEDWKADKHIAADRGASWMDGRFLQGTFTSTYAVNDPRPDVNCGGEGGLSGLRSTTAGTNVGMCDGSVRYIGANIKAAIWQKAGNYKNTDPFTLDR